MKRNEFDAQFPELFDWHELDGNGSRTVCEVARRLQYRTKADLKTKDRLYAPGMREALNVLKAVYDEMQ